MYTFEKKYSGLYRLTINGKPIKQQVAGIDIVSYDRKERSDILRITVKTLDGETLRLATDGYLTIGEIVNRICRMVREKEGLA